MCSELHLQAFMSTPSHVHVQFNLQQFKMLSLPHFLCYLSQPFCQKFLPRWQIADWSTGSFKSYRSSSKGTVLAQTRFHS